MVEEGERSKTGEDCDLKMFLGAWTGGNVYIWVRVVYIMKSLV